jgi:outer membrane autotransporter protein
VDALGILAQGTGNVAVTSSGSVATSGDGATGILAPSEYGDVSVTAGNVATQGDNASGISAIAYGVTGYDTDGNAVATGGNVTVTTTGTVSTIGDNSVGVSANSVYRLGDATVTVGNVTTAGNYSAGVVAQGVNAAVTVNGAINTAGDYSYGVIALGSGGTASVVNNGTITTAGYHASGIEAIATGDVSVSGAGTVTTTGDYARGIQANSLEGAVSVTTGDVSTAGNYATGISATTPYADAAGVTVNATSVTTKGDYSGGIYAYGGSGPVNVTSTGTVSTAGLGSFGVVAESFGGDTNVVVNNVTTTGDDGFGVLAIGDHTTVTVNGDLSTTGTQASLGSLGGRGVEAEGLSSATVTVNGSVKTAGDYATGVFVRAFGGYADGDATVVNDGTISTAGVNADAVNIGSAAGTSTVTNDGTISTSGRGSVGIRSNQLYDIVVDGTGAIETSGLFGDGVNAFSRYGTVAVTQGSVSTTGDYAVGVHADGYYGATVNVGKVSTSGYLSPAVQATATYGDVSVTTGTVTTTGDISVGVFAASYQGNVDVNATNVSTTGAHSYGVQVLDFGGSAEVTSTGTISTTGANTNAVIVNTYPSLFGYDGGGVSTAAVAAADLPVGTAEANVNNVTASGAGSSAVVVNGAYAVANVTGTVTGNVDGLNLTSVYGSTVTNSGTINTGSGYAIDVTGGAATVTNSGTINGRISLTDNDDVVTNSGSFNATSNSDFGAGNDVFNNSGAVTVGKTGKPVSVTFQNLETFNNNGLVDLRDGVVGDTLTVPGAFNASGASALGVDVGFGATASADVLHVGSATGTTLVSVAGLGNHATFTDGVTVVKLDTASTGNAFVINPSARDIGFVHYSLVYNPTALAYQLVGTPSGAAYQVGVFAQGAQQLWYKSADAVIAHLGAVRDAGGAASSDAKGAAWLQMYGQSDKREHDGAFQAGAGDAVNANLGFAQDSFGGQLGYDIGGIGEDGGILFGATGGYQNSRINLAGTDNHLEFDSVNAGVYATFKAGPFFINGLGKYDKYWGHAGSALLGYADKLNGNSWGGQIEIGARLGSDSFFAEPIASIAYVHTSLDKLHALDTTFDFDNFNGLRGKAGLKVGGTADMMGQKVTFYLSGEAVHEFKGKDDVAISNAGGAFGFRSVRLPTYGKGTLGFNIASGSTVSGFVEGFGDYGKDYKGGGGRAGISLKF